MSFFYTLFSCLWSRIKMVICLLFSFIQTKTINLLATKELNLGFDEAVIRRTPSVYTFSTPVARPRGRAPNFNEDECWCSHLLLLLPSGYLHIPSDWKPQELDEKIYISYVVSIHRLSWYTTSHWWSNRYYCDSHLLKMQKVDWFYLFQTKFAFFFLKFTKVQFSILL